MHRSCQWRRTWTHRRRHRHRHRPRPRRNEGDHCHLRHYGVKVASMTTRTNGCSINKSRIGSGSRKRSSRPPPPISKNNKNKAALCPGYNQHAGHTILRYRYTKAQSYPFGLSFCQFHRSEHMSSRERVALNPSSRSARAGFAVRSGTSPGRRATISYGNS